MIPQPQGLNTTPKLRNYGCYNPSALGFCGFPPQLEAPQLRGLLAAGVCFLSVCFLPETVGAARPCTCLQHRDAVCRAGSQVVGLAPRDTAEFCESAEARTGPLLQDPKARDRHPVA